MKLLSYETGIDEETFQPELTLCLKIYTEEIQDLIGQFGEEETAQILGNQLLAIISNNRSK